MPFRVELAEGTWDVEVRPCRRGAGPADGWALCKRDPDTAGGELPPSGEQ